MRKDQEISHEGRIISITPEFTTVEILSESACASCHAASLCGMSEAKRKEIELPTNGNNVVTSIDINAQKIVQQNVENYMNTEGAKNVSVLVMDPKTCHVIALYNSHNFDPNDAYDLKACRYQFESEEEYQAFLATDSDAAHVEALENVWHNFIVSDAFEPGSTYKTFTISTVCFSETDIS